MHYQETLSKLLLGDKELAKDAVFGYLTAPCLYQERDMYEHNYPDAAQHRQAHARMRTAAISMIRTGQYECLALMLALHRDTDDKAYELWMAQQGLA